jgi:hypothetical protein
MIVRSYHHWDRAHAEMDYVNIGLLDYILLGSCDRDFH